jgi:hypothetical protein
MPQNQPHERPLDLSSIDYLSLTMEQRYAFRRAAIRQAHYERDAALRAIFAGLTRGIRSAFSWLGARKRNRPVTIPGRTIAQL